MIEGDGPVARATFWAAVLFAFVMAVLPHPPELPGQPSDKVQHIIAFVTLALLASWAYPGAGMVRLLAGLSLFGAVIELAQTIPSLHRDSDVVDWVADTVAAGSVLFFVHWWRRRRNRQR